jgi:hypothetical protein
LCNLPRRSQHLEGLLEKSKMWLATIPLNTAALRESGRCRPATARASKGGGEKRCLSGRDAMTFRKVADLLETLWTSKPGRVCWD